ncbi:MAG: ribonuclease P protein component [Armatimonadetes bacterium RBG_16_67_12]|nr:MAG: ribonuclease P protein component [Armatimonadetes bacterium RBG_16_67_12]
MTADLTIGRLARADDFRRAYREGARRATPLLVIHTRPNGLEAVRLGIVVSRRFGHAAARNRLRRRLREAVRARREMLGIGTDVVVVPKDAAAAASFAGLRAAVATALGAKEAPEAAPGGERT